MDRRDSDDVLADSVEAAYYISLLSADRRRAALKILAKYAGVDPKPERPVLKVVKPGRDFYQ